MKITPHLIKIVGILLTSIVTIVIAIALFLPYLLDLNAYRSEIVTAIQNSLGRKVSFNSGSFAWHLGPSFDFKEFAVKEKDGKTDFISAKQITVQLALLPLLEKRVQLRKLILDGTVVSLYRSSDGTLNIDDLMKTSSSDLRINFRKITIKNGSVLWRDNVVDKIPFSLSLKNISLVADHLNSGQNGGIKLTAEIPSGNRTPTIIALNGKINLPGSGKPLIETFLDCALSVKSAEPDRFWLYFARFVPFGNTGGRVDFLTNFKGTPLDFSADGKITVTGAKLIWPTVFHTSLSPKNLQLDYKLALNRQLINFSSVDLSMEGFRIKGSFELHDYLSKDPRIVTKASTPSTFRYEDVRDYVPYGIIIDPDVVDYIKNKIKTGVFKLDEGVLNGRISQITQMEVGQNYNTLMIRGTVNNGLLSYGSKAPTFNSLNGTIELKGKNFNLLGMTGNFGKSPFSLNGSIVEYNTDKQSNYPISMNISPSHTEMAWLGKLAGIPSLEYSGNSSLSLSGNGQISAYRLNGEWNLNEAFYSLPGYVTKPMSMPHNIKFNSIIAEDETKVTNVNYNLQPLVVTGSGLIGYGKNAYLGFDLQSNAFLMNESLPILQMWRQYKPVGRVKAHIKGGGDPADMSAMDYHGTVNISDFSILPDDQLKTIKGMNGSIIFKGNSLETDNIQARYENSDINLKAAIKSLKNPEGEITLSSSQFYLSDINSDLKTPDLAFKRVNSDLIIREGHIDIKKLSGVLNSSNFHLNGVYHTGSKQQANISVTSTKLDVNDLLLLTSSEKKSSSGQNSKLNIKMALNVQDGNFGKMLFHNLNAAAEQENGIIYLKNLTANLQDGKLSAKGRIAPDGVNGDRYDLSFDITNADAENLFEALEFSREVTGKLTLHADLTARGKTLLEIKRSALGNLRLNMDSGKIRKFSTLSKVFSILNVSQLLKFEIPDMASGGMPYKSIKGSIAVKDGTLSTEDLFISSNAINVSIIGTADIVNKELNLTLGAQPLQTVDKIVNRIPIVGWLLKGEEKDLVTAYFEAKGKWSDPDVSPIQVKSMGKGILNIFIRAFQLPVKLFTDTGDVILGK
ncbi:MAG: AsmA-like C-terminal domain-containing protein [Desulfuromonadaceae bacterium]|nr:AsmA-like C-terminal domain-containing protein [Desulfuromonadaceae bacterium]MDD2854896.1 AsmA-like C-terminal domain-containing protein [Desulfuromonadaceae bacterium]